MLTTGFKFFFGLFAAFAGAALVYGYASGGNHVGPLSLGWKGGVGDHIGYGVLVTLAAVALAVSLLLVSFRDADADAQAHLQGADEVPSGPSATAGWWPTACAFGAGAALVGLVLHPAVFALGLAVIALALVEWTMDAWADRATGDRAANRALRSRIMTPIEIPVIGALAIGVTVLAASRILLTVSALGAVVAAGVISTLIVIGAAVYANRPGLGRRLVAGLGVVAALGLLVGGILAAVRGEREFHVHEIHETDGPADTTDGQADTTDGHDGSGDE